MKPEVFTGLDEKGQNILRKRFLGKTDLLLYSLENIFKRVCEYYQIDPEKASGRSRESAYKTSRQVYCYLAKKYTPYSLAKIGKVINRDHATVLHSIKVIEGLCFNDNEIFNDKHLKRQIKEIEFRNIERRVKKY